MLLRWLLGSVLHQTAERTVREAVSRAARAARDAVRDEADRRERQLQANDEIPPGGVVVLFGANTESGGLVDLLQDCVTTRCATFLEHAGRLDGRRVVAVESGVGRRAAARATEDVIAVHRPSWIVSAGFAAALREELRRGHIVMADSVADEHGNRLSVGLKMDPETIQGNRSLHVGRLLSMERVVQTPEQRRRLGEEHAAWACDMETMAVAEVCRRAKVRFLAVRVITDVLEDQLPTEIECLAGQSSTAGKLGVAAGAVLKRPAVVKLVWKLREDAIKASDRLAKCLAGVLPQLESGS